MKFITAFFVLLIAYPSISEPENISYAERRAARLAKVESEIERLLPQLSLEEKISLLHANGKFTIASIERLGIHEMWMSDGPHGVRRELNRNSWEPAGWTSDQASYLPVLTSVAASWNREMAYLHGDVLGAEARHRGKDLILGPGVNLARLPLYGRNFEYLGEDPILAGKLAAAAIRGIQVNDVAATAKHYALNTQELNRIAVDAQPDERTLREVYLPAFEMAVKEGGVLAIMGAYNEFRGTNANQSAHLINTILKGEWGYKGLVVTDWGCDINTYDAAMNGLDIEMGTRVDNYDDYFLAQPLLKMVKAGKVPEAVIDDKVRRILRVQLSIGMMDKYRLGGERNTQAHQAAARKIATEGVVLLKNNQLLPLNKKEIKNILVLGPNANRQHALGGGSSEVLTLHEVTPLEGLKQALGETVNITHMRVKNESELMPIAADYLASRHWTGTPAWNMKRLVNGEEQTGLENTTITNSAYHSPEGIEKETVILTAQIKTKEAGMHRLKLESIGETSVLINGELTLKHHGKTGELISKDIELKGNELYNFEIRYEGNQYFTLGWDAAGNLFTPQSEMLEAAKNADAVVYFGGLSHSDDREALDRESMTLPGGQDAVIEKVLAANPNTLVFLIAGSAVEMPWAEKAKGILWSSYAGMEGGHAFADIIFGNANPSGKLPFTLYKTLQDNSAIALNDYRPDIGTYPDGVFVGYRWLEKNNIEPLFAFGHGLSYSNFEITTVRLSKKQIKAKDTLKIKVRVKNTGKRAGAEVVQVYVKDIESSVERPVKELKAFEKVYLEPGQTKTVSFNLNKRDFSFWDTPNNRWYAEPGKFAILVGNAVNNIQQTAEFTLVE